MTKTTLTIMLLILIPCVLSFDATITAPENNTYLSQIASIDIDYNNIANITIAATNASGSISTIANVSSMQGPYSAIWETDNLSYPDGVYNITAIITNTNDTADNITLTALNITIDNTPPQIVWQWPIENTTLLTYYSIGMFRYTLSVNYTERNKAPSGDCQIGYQSPSSGTNYNINTQGENNNTITFYSGWPEWTFLIGVYCTDAAGNSYSDSTKWLYFDNRSPVIYINNSMNVTSDVNRLNITIQEWNPAYNLLEYTLAGPQNRSGNITLDRFTAKNSMRTTLQLSNGVLRYLPGSSRTIYYNYSFANNTFFPDLLNGRYTLTLTATDALNNIGMTTINFSVNDSTAPRWTQSITNTTANRAALVITNNESTRYNISLNGSSITNTTAINTTILLNGLDQSTSYLISVTACDLNSNCNTTYTTFATHTIPCITAPQNNTYQRQNISINLTYNYNATIMIAVNGSQGITTLTNTTIAGPYTTTWYTNNNSFPDGNYQLTATITNTEDPTDNTTITISNITIDNTPPNITWIWPITNITLVNYNSPEITLTPSGQNYIISTIGTLNTTEQNFDNENSLCQYQAFYTRIYIGASGSSSDIITENGPKDLSVNLNIQRGSPSHQDQLIVLDFNCTDLAGNTYTKVPRQIRLDNASPIMNIYAPTNSGLNYNGLNISIDEWNPTNSFLSYNLSGQQNSSGTITLNQFAPLFNYTRNITFSAMSVREDPITIPLNYSYANLTQFNHLLNGRYTLTLTARDALGNNATRQVNFTMNDTTPPIWNQTVTDISTASALLNITGTENTTYNISINDIPLLSNTTINLTTTLTDLTVQTTYTLSVTGCDPNNNCNTTNTTFTTAAEPTTPQQENSHGGGSSGSAAPLLATPEEIIAPTTTKLTTYSTYQFKHGGEKHKISVQTITPNTITLLIQSTPQLITLTNNTPKDIDLNNDTIADITITATITRNTATLNITPINKTQTPNTKEAPQQTTPQQKTQEITPTESPTQQNTAEQNQEVAAQETTESVQNVQPKSTSKTPLIIGAVLLLIIATSITLAIKQKRKR